MLDEESTDITTPATAETAEAPKKAPRKRATRAAAAPSLSEPAEGAAPENEAAPAKKAPAKKAAPRKRTPKADAVAEAPAASTEVADVPEEAPAEPAPRKGRAPAVVVTFQAPEPTEVAPRPRRRAGTAGAVSPEDVLAESGTRAPAKRTAKAAPKKAAQDTESEAELAENDLDEAEIEAEEGLAGNAARRRRRGRRGRGGRPQGAEGSEDEADETAPDAEGAEGAEDGDDEDDDNESGTGTRRRRRRRRSSGGGGGGGGAEDGDEVPTVVHVREPRQRARKDGGGEADEDGVRGISGSTRMAAKRVRRQEGRDSGRKRAPILTESEFLARRESVDRQMIVRQKGDRTQIAVLEDGILVEHYVTKASATSYAGNVYVGKVQNVLPSMEAAFVDVGKGRNAVLYAGEVNWEGVSGGSRKIEQVLKSGQEVLVQVTKDPIGHKGARLTSQISLPGRYLVYVPEGSMTGISRKLPENERTRLKNILKNVLPEGAGVIIRTAAEGASEEEISKDVRRLQAQWEVIKEKAEKGGAPKLLHAEPDLVIKVVRDVFNEDFKGLTVQGDSEWDTIRDYVEFVAPDLADRMKRHTGDTDVFAEYRIDEQLLKALDRKVYLPSGGSLVIDRTEAMVVIDVNTGKYVGKGGNLEETVTRNNLEAAEEIARQLRLRDVGGIIVIDFIDMVLESNRDLVVRRLVECLGRDRTKHQVAEVTSLGLVQMTRKRVGQGLLESFSETCEACNGRGHKVHLDPIAPSAPKQDRDRTPKVGPKAPVPAGTGPEESAEESGPARPRRRRGGRGTGSATVAPESELSELLAEEPDAEIVEPTVPAILAEETALQTPQETVEQAPAAAQPAAEAPVEEPDPVAEEPGVPAAVEPEPAAEAAPKRRRAAGRPAGAPTV